MLGVTSEVLLKSSAARNSTVDVARLQLCPSKNLSRDGSACRGWSVHWWQTIAYVVRYRVRLRWPSRTITVCAAAVLRSLVTAIPFGRKPTAPLGRVVLYVRRPVSRPGVRCHSRWRRRRELQQETTRPTQQNSSTSACGSSSPSRRPGSLGCVLSAPLPHPTRDAYCSEHLLPGSLVYGASSSYLLCGMCERHLGTSRRVLIPENPCVQPSMRTIISARLVCRLVFFYRLFSQPTLHT